MRESLMKQCYLFMYILMSLMLIDASVHIGASNVKYLTESELINSEGGGHCFTDMFTDEENKSFCWNTAKNRRQKLPSWSYQ